MYLRYWEWIELALVSAACISAREIKTLRAEPFTMIDNLPLLGPALAIRKSAPVTFIVFQSFGFASRQPAE